MDSTHVEQLQKPCCLKSVKELNLEQVSKHRTAPIWSIAQVFSDAVASSPEPSHLLHAAAPTRHKS